MVSSSIAPQPFLRQDFLLNLKLTDWLECLASELQRSSCPNKGIRDARHCAGFIKEVPGIYTHILRIDQPVLY